MEEDTATRLEVIVMILMDKCTGRVKAKKESLQLNIRSNPSNGYGCKVA